jgi:MFS family permease
MATTLQRLAKPALSSDGSPYRLRWAAPAVLSAALTMVIAANTSLVDAIVNIQKDLHPTTTKQDWIVDAYPLAVGSLLLFFGTVGDRYGRRLALCTGLVIFAGASVFGVLANSADQLIAARALLGVGGAFIMPATLAYVRLLFPAHERKKAFAIWSGSSGLGLVGGPLVAGALMSPIGWQGTFWVNLAMCAALLTGALLTVPPSRNEAARRIDVPGALLAVATVAPLIYATIEASQYGWTSGRVLGGFGGAIVGLIAFCAWETYTSSPMLDLKWFRSRPFRIGAALIVLGFTAGIGILYASALFIEEYLLHGALRSGVEMLPLGIGIVSGAALNGRIVPRLGLRWPIVGSLLVAAAGAGVLIHWHTNYTADGIALAIMGLGTGFFLPSLTEEVMNGAPREAGGVAGATADVAVEIGAALGVGLISSLISSGYHSKLPEQVHKLPHPAYQAVHDSLFGAHAVADKLPPDKAHALINSANTAWLHGFKIGAIVVAGIYAVTALLATRLPKLPAEPEADEPGAEQVAVAVVDAPATGRPARDYRRPAHLKPRRHGETGTPKGSGAPEGSDR